VIRHAPEASARKVDIPKGGGKMRQLSIPSIRDRVVQGALKLVLEPIFEAEDFQPGSFGYRPKKPAHTALPVFGPDAFGYACCLLRASIHALS
jgi:hypothetical protein